MGGFRDYRPKRIAFAIAAEVQDIFGQFNILSIIRGQRQPDAYAELVRREVEQNAALLGNTWLNWEDFERAMRERGVAVSRTTIYDRRKRGEFSDLVVTDGASTLYQLEGFLQFFQGSA